MEALKITIQSDRKKAEIFNKIMEKDHHYWKRLKGPDDVFRWLDNFSGERETYLALVLADNIMYYTFEQVQYLWRRILTNRVKLWLLDEVAHILPVDIEKWFEDYLRSKCVFVGFGRASESGQSMPNVFKHSHDVKGLKYMELFELLCADKEMRTVEIVFLLDDFIGNGDQAIKEWHRKRGEKGQNDEKSLDDLHKKNPHLRFVYLALVGCKEGKKAIEDHTSLKIILGEELDEKFKCFSDKSLVFTGENERNEARQIMEQKGKMLYEHPLGYGNMQLAIAFFNNTPNDSLPVIWKRMKDGSWYPLFERFE